MRGLLALATAAALLSAVAAVVQGDVVIELASLTLGGASLLRLARDPMPSTDSAVFGRLVRVLVRGTVLVVSLLMAVAAAEGLARWVYRDVTTTADFRGYFTTKWLRAQVRHNHYDYRGGEFEEVKPRGTYRVAVMGDSITYGNGVPEDRRFSNLLDARLRGRGIEVLNFGFPGNNWPEHVKTLERRVLRLTPDFVLLQWGTNDVELDRDVAGRPSIPALISNRDWHESLHAVSALYTLVNAQWIRFQLARQMGDSYADHMRRLYGDPNSEGSVQAAALMRRFIELCRSRGVAVGILLFPDAAVSLGADYPYRFLHERVLAICAEQAIPCVDLQPVFARVEDRHTLWASPLDSHPSVLANQLAADQVMATFARRWNATATAGR